MHGTRYSTYFINKSVRKLLLRSAQMQSVTTRWRCSKSEPLLSVTAFFKIIIYSESTNTFYIEVFNVSNRKIKSKYFCYDPLETVLCTNRKTYFNSETDHKCFKWHVNDFFVECRPKRQRQCLCCLSKFITANWYLCWLKKQCIWLDGASALVGLTAVLNAFVIWLSCAAEQLAEWNRLHFSEQKHLGFKRNTAS